MVADSILLHAECGPNDNRRDASPFKLSFLRKNHKNDNWGEFLDFDGSTPNKIFKSFTKIVIIGTIIFMKIAKIMYRVNSEDFGIYPSYYYWDFP